MTTAHDFTFTSIEGRPMPMTQFRGKIVLLVNTASACGLTPQYKGLQALWSSHKDKGLVVLGVPCNDFGAQEPGTETEVQAFCETRFGVDFPLTSKEHVIGADAHPLYKWIAGELGEGATPKWNFHKYLLGKNGEILETFGSRVEPSAPELIKAVEGAV
jgi:glutathione peroxidase